MKIRMFLGALPLFFVACKVPEQRQATYSNGYLKERYWVYKDGGREVMNGLYTSWYPNGEKEVEILYRDGSVVEKMYYNDHGTRLGSIDLAALPDQ